METPYENNYYPLVFLILVAVMAAGAICYGVDCSGMKWMHYFMGLLFCLFALLKLFDIPGFADGFQMYDILAKKSRTYALSYPFIELVLGLAYLSFISPPITYFITVIFMLIGTIGVVKALQKKMNVNCACMGSVLKVPLSVVTLTEDIGMGLMALMCIILWWI